MANPGMWVADKRYYVDRAPTDPKAQIVDQGSPRAAFVLVPAGGEIPLDQARRLGLTTEKPSAKTEEAQPEPGMITAGTNRPDKAEVIQMGGESKAEEADEGEPKAPAKPPKAEGK